MARIDDLIEQVPDSGLRQRLKSALADIKKRQRFGLVYEEHLPETTTLLHVPIQVGATVQRRSDLDGQQLFLVKRIDGPAAFVEAEGSGREERVLIADLCVVKRFGDPVFPALIPISGMKRGAEGRPHHAVVKGENFHVLQLLVYMYEGQFDCIYIDPPYNTGARDWKYNNRYVDENDSWRHSKWLSMMDKRLRIAKRLLKPDGVLICTIDEYEVNHLGMLLEKVFPEYLHYMLTIVINPKGRAKANFAPVDEKAYFVIPKTGEDVYAVPGLTVESWTPDEALALLLGKEPMVVTTAAMSAEREALARHLAVGDARSASPFVMRYERLRVQAERASAMQSERLKPSDVLAWASTSGAVSPPQDLVDALAVLASDSSSHRSSRSATGNAMERPNHITGKHTD